jgi:hypothetical protein
MLVCSCDPAAPPPKTTADTPLLSVSPGDFWVYQVHLEIPAGVTSAGASAVDTKFRRVRTYLGKRSAAEGLPETDCFEVTVPGFPDEREFVEIHADRILMRGSLIMRPETTMPMWLETPVPFVIAGLNVGDTVPAIRTSDESLTRRTEVLARGNVSVPAGSFDCIHLLTTGNDGDIILCREVWFAPGRGIIRERKSRLSDGLTIYEETQELVEFHAGRGAELRNGGQDVRRE